MENINVTLGIQQDAIEKISELVQENIKDTIAEAVKDDFQEEVTEKVIDYIRDDYDISDSINSWMDYNFDIEDYLRNAHMDLLMDANKSRAVAFLISKKLSTENEDQVVGTAPSSLE